MPSKAFLNEKPPYNVRAFGYTRRIFWIFISEKGIGIPSQCHQWVFAEFGIGDGKIAITLVKGKVGAIPAFHGMEDLQDKVWSIIKAKIVDENNAEDEEELLRGN